MTHTHAPRCVSNLCAYPDGGKGTETHISQAGRLSTWGQPARSLPGAPSSSYHRGAKSVPTLRRSPTVAWVRGCGHESIYDFEHIRFREPACRITCVLIMSHLLLSASDGFICQNANKEDLCKTVKLSILFASSSNVNNY